MRLIKACITVLFIGFLAGVFGDVAMAKERTFAVGINSSLNTFLEPVNELGDNSINLQFDYFLTEHLVITNHLDFGFNGFYNKYFITGAKWLPFTASWFWPYLAVQAVFQLDDRFDAGFRGSGGFQLDLTEIIGFYNVFLYYESNISILFRDPESAFIDIYRVGILFAF